MPIHWADSRRSRPSHFQAHARTHARTHTRTHAHAHLQRGRNTHTFRTTLAISFSYLFVTSCKTISFSLFLFCKETFFLSRHLLKCWRENYDVTKSVIWQGKDALRGTKQTISRSLITSNECWSLALLWFKSTIYGTRWKNSAMGQCNYSTRVLARWHEGDFRGGCPLGMTFRS